MFKEEMVASMEEVVVFKHMQQNNSFFCEFVVHLQNAQTSMSLG
jgi:hypothetical protein